MKIELTKLSYNKHMPLVHVNGKKVSMIEIRSIYEVNCGTSRLINLCHKIDFQAKINFEFAHFFFFLVHSQSCT